MEPFATVEDASRIRPVPALDGVAMLVPDYTRPAVRIYGFADAKEKAAVVYDPRQRFAAYGVSEDGKQLALLHGRSKDESEEKITGRNIPEALRKERGCRARRLRTEARRLRCPVPRVRRRDGRTDVREAAVVLVSGLRGCPELAWGRTCTWSARRISAPGSTQRAR